MEENIKQMNDTSAQEYYEKSKVLEKKLKKLNVKRLIRKIFLVIFSLIVLIISLITLASTVKASDLAFLKYRFYIMKSTSQPDIAQSGDLIIAKRTDADQIKVGDNIVYADNNFYHCNSVIDTRESDETNSIIIAEKDGVKYKFCDKDIEGKIIKVIPSLGDILRFWTTPVGFVFFMLIVVCLIIMLRIIFIDCFNDKKGNIDRYNKQQN